MKRWEPKEILILILILIVPYYLGLITITFLIDSEFLSNDEVGSAKEIMIYILGLVSGLLGQYITKKDQK